MKLQHQIEGLIARQASEWIETLQTGGERERAAFVAWLKESRRHVAEFLAMVAVDRELNGIDAERRHDLEALIRKVAPGSGGVTRLESAKTGEHRRVGERRWPLAIAAALLLLSIGVYFGVYRAQWAWQDYSTLTGEQRTLRLTDGSVVHLNTQSRLRVRMGENSRDLTLVDGEALFKVAHDAQRPFLVRTASATVQAVGTEFNVHARSNETTVSVLEGKVRVEREGGRALESAPVLSAGQEVSIGRQGSMRQEVLKDAEKVLAWRQRRLVFRDDTLEDIAAEFNRYNQAPQFRLEGAATRRRHYSGTFDADDPQSLAALLSRESGISVQTTGGEIVVRPAP